jgi:exosortase B
VPKYWTFSTRYDTLMVAKNWKKPQRDEKMTQSYVLPARTSKSVRGAGWYLLLLVATFVAYIPTFVHLIQGPWQTEQEGHGPLIIAASLWLVWASRERLVKTEIVPAPVVGWALLVVGLAMLFIARTQNIISVEVLSELPVIAGCILMLSGWKVLKVLAFPIGFLFFTVPAPGWMVDGATVPLKVFISDCVTRFLYAAGYPIAQNGVVIMIGPYQLLMQDACAGMNSIFALSAIGMFYVYAFRWKSKLRSVILLATVIPITIIANFLRVLMLVLIAYYGGIELVDGLIHDLTGIALFVFALALLFILDGLLSLVGAAGRAIWSHHADPSLKRMPSI